jgi:Tfp pilus assembly protein PilO
VSLALQPHNQCSAINFLNASQIAMVKIVFLLLLVATCVALSYAGLWMEWRNRAVAVIQLVSRIRPLRRFYSPASRRRAPLMAGPSNVKGT